MSSYQLNAAVTLMLVIALSVLHSGSAHRYQYPEKRVTTLQKYCGQNLADALQLACGGVYNPLFKKSGQEMKVDDYPNDYGDGYLFKTRASANMLRLAGRFRRATQGVHDECCKKACSMEELGTYCFKE